MACEPAHGRWRWRWRVSVCLFVCARAFASADGHRSPKGRAVVSAPLFFRRQGP